VGAFGFKRAPKSRPASKEGDGPEIRAPLSFPDYRIDTAVGLVSIRFTGKLTFSDIVNYVSCLRADPRFNPTFAEIVDLRQVESVELSARETMDLADQVDPFSFDSKRAFVAQSQAQIRAAHLHRILRTERKTIHVFLSIEEARKWIGCVPDLSDTKPGI